MVQIVKYISIFKVGIRHLMSLEVMLVERKGF